MWEALFAFHICIAHFINLPMLMKQAERVCKKKRMLGTEKRTIVNLHYRIANPGDRACSLAPEHKGGYAVN